LFEIKVAIQGVSLWCFHAKVLIFHKIHSIKYHWNFVG
jgi:hypothetical protein